MTTPRAARVAERIGRALVPGLPFLWLVLFFLVPFLIVLKISLSDPAIAQPPYRPALAVSAGLEGLRAFLAGLDLETFRTLLADDLYLGAALSSLRIALVSTAILLLVGYPIAYAMASAPARWRLLLVAFVILPFWTSFLIRVYAWIGILRSEGLLNQALLALGAIAEPLTLLNTDTAV
ncbi:MAG TPA: putrescine ABC transporter permease PotH, partial [Beijerinckiaceae bacterium]|nr:putrescine ABC transporter permease PotH [Beijerinckiaceae bacterium]